MNENPMKVKCPCCGSIVYKIKFCVECGSPLENALPADKSSLKTDPQTLQRAADQESQPAVPIPGGMSSPGPFGFVDGKPPVMWPQAPQPADPQGSQPEEEAADDSGLTILVDFCRKTVATVGGDGYDETVLYRDDKDGSLQIHTYSKYQYMPKEIHRSYKVKEGADTAAFALIEELKLAEYEGKRGFGLCGGMYICKFLKDGKLIRITTDNMGYEGPSAIIAVGNLLGEYIVRPE